MSLETEILSSYVSMNMKKTIHDIHVLGVISDLDHVHYKWIFGITPEEESTGSRTGTKKC